MTQEEIINLALLISPILLIQLGMVIYALIDLAKRQQVHGARWAWALGLVLTALALPSGMIAAALYLVWGRHVEDKNEPANDTN